MTRCLNTADILKAHKSGQPTVIQSVEGGHFLEGKVDRLQLAYDRGLRHLGLLHDHDASTPLGDIFTEPPRWGGLTKFGASVIRESERLGILVDLAHADDNTTNGALKVATKPVIITHTGLNTRLGNNPAMAKMMLPRLISKSQAKIVASQGGVIGVWTHLADNAQQMADNIKAMVDVVGIDHVAIGTDTKLTTPYHSPKDHFEQHDKNKQVHPAVINGSTKEPRKSNHQHRPSGETTTNSLWPPLTKGGASGFYYELVAALLKAGYDQKAIGKIGGGNYLRVFDLATAKQA
ncbi:dipeptidase [Arachidicoccus ginsenosidivorans]|uniref:dipeptidase n=1 Tax=Arachidicoccus ginsenosidivorans TaxID=496057 RepID=UPI001CEF9901|nr:membrane dipeptidase [Arachidicoccus ginsenosidivorans]